MLKSLRARLWIGYSFLILAVLGAFFIGLFVTLNRTSALYRQTELTLRLEQQQLLQQIEIDPDHAEAMILRSIRENPAEKPLRIFLLDNQGNVVFDSQSLENSSIQWKTLLRVRKSSNLDDAEIIRDSSRIAWIYVARKLKQSNQFLVVASPRGNLTIKFMLSDPMIRMIFRVLTFAILVSVLLTFIMDRWIARPIRQMAKAARTMALVEHKQLLIEGPKEVQDLAVALNQMNRQVQESQQSQRDFVSDVSHELKTPLTSIQGFANAVLDGTANDEDKIKHAAQVIVNESERMQRLVVDLLTLTRLEGGVEKIQKTPINLNELTASVVEKISLIADQARIRIDNSVQGLPIVNADPDRITQVLTNLLDNAVKYSHPGSHIELSGNMIEQTVRINVVDHGIGISAENLSRIFNRFYQVDKSRAGGTRKSAGLGLPIARQIALAHGGDILISSIPGQGSVFTFVLPIANIR